MHGPSPNWNTWASRGKARRGDPPIGMNTPPWHRRLPWITAYAVAMAMLEAAVVIDLRALHYPDGSLFPLVPMDRTLARVELFRELATMVMLLVPGAFVASTALDRFAWFCMVFGIWDLFYYVFLCCFIGWPGSLLEWDLLFLIPVPWVGPVIAPCIVSLGLIAFGMFLLRARERDPSASPGPRQWSMLSTGAALILLSFVIGPLMHVLDAGGSVKVWSLDLAGGDSSHAFATYQPERFPWALFGAGVALAALPIAALARRAWR